jgi:hypothetical protein
MAGGRGRLFRSSPSASARTSKPGSELALRHLADSCLLLVDRQLQLAQEFAHPRQSPFGFALPAQDHEVVSIGGCPGRIIAVVLMDFTSVNITLDNRCLGIY